MCLTDILSLTFPYQLYPFPAVRTLLSVSARCVGPAIFASGAIARKSLPLRLL